MIIPEWLNIDKVAHKGVLQYDLRQGIPAEDESVDLIHCSHMLDHLDFYAGVALLHECKRVMTDGAVARFAVMDLGKILNVYNQGKMDIFNDCQPEIYQQIVSPSLKLGVFLFGNMGRQKEYQGHHFTADVDGWKEYFHMAGWPKAYDMPFGISHSEVMRKETKDLYPNHSLYLEIIKVEEGRRRI